MNLTETRGNDLSSMLDAVSGIASTITSGAESAEANRRLDDGVFRAMVDAGLTAMPCPKALGGHEMHALDLIKVWEAIARLDPAASWNLLMTSTMASTASAFLTQDGVDAVFGAGPTTMAGSFYPPPAFATRTKGGWHLHGQSGFFSGAHHASWILVAAIEVADGEPVLNADTGTPDAFGAILPRSDVTLIDTWHTMGMRGTGSVDVRIDGAFVPSHLTFHVAPLTKTTTAFSGPLPRMFPLILVLGESSVSLGIAAEAVTRLRRLAEQKTAAFTATGLRDRELIQYLAGKAKSRVDAARAYLHQMCATAYDEASDGHLTMDTKADLQLAVTYSTELCAESVRLVHEAVGASGVRNEAGFERFFRDAHTLTQHANHSSSRYATVGKLLFGLDNDWIALSF
jgi:alkylation response protein AidB-like acyl-CoA dehydrogenase